MSIRSSAVLRLGAAAWIATALYFPLQIVVAMAWPGPYSFRRNAISDLGVTTCDVVASGEMLICSPRHAWMNIGFIAFGVMTIIGAVLIGSTLRRSRLMTIALIGVIITGAGGILVGLAPLDRAHQAHVIGAQLRGPGVIAPLLVGLVIRRRRPALAAFCAGITIAAAAGTVLYALRMPADSSGATERFALDPFTVWAVVLGIALLRDPRSLDQQRLE